MSFNKKIAQEMQNKINEQKAKQKRFKRIIKYLLLYFLIITCIAGIIYVFYYDYTTINKQIQEQDYLMVVYYPYKGSLEEFYKTEKDTLLKLLKNSEEIIEFTKVIVFKPDSNYLTIYIYNK